jgi:hypothetical protein
MGKACVGDEPGIGRPTTDTAVTRYDVLRYRSSMSRILACVRASSKVPRIAPRRGLEIRRGGDLIVSYRIRGRNDAARFAADAWKLPNSS